MSLLTLQDLAERWNTDFRTRFWDRVDKTSSEQGCWEWTAARTAAGYGLLRNAGDLLYAHRTAWAMASGQDIPEGLFVLHHCDNRKCVNPEHLYVGTSKDNARDRTERRRFCGEDIPGSKLTESDVRAIRRSYKKGQVGYRRLGKRYDVDQTTIRAIVKGWTWQHV